MSEETEPLPKGRKPSKTDHTDEDGPVIRYILSCRNESKLAKWNRTMQTRENWDIYWLRQNFSHKSEGQSREVLSMQPMAVETTAASFQQSLVDLGDEWWSVDSTNPQNEPFLKLDPETIRGITKMQLHKINIIKHVVHGLKSGLLGGNVIAKIHGDFYDVPRYVAKRKLLSRKAELKKELKKCWKSRVDIVSQFNYYPDPTPTNHRRLYEIEDMWMDYHEVLAMSEGEDAIYDKKIVEQVEHNADDEAEAKFDEMRRTNQNGASHSFRGRVKITEFWGTLLDEDDNVMKDKNGVPFDNCVVTLANDKWLIRKPEHNPLWHQESPYVVANFLDIPDAVWPKALMDSPTKHNIAATELYNLMVDGAMAAVNNVKMLRTDWLESPDQIEGGIKPGQSLTVNSQCPPGAKALEMCQTGAVPPEALQMYNIIQQEFNRDALTSDIRQGKDTTGNVSATQVVETNQTIGSVLKGLAANVEQQWLERLLNKIFITSMQYSDLMDEDEIRAALSPDRAGKFLALTPEERFANTVRGLKFRVNGLSLTLQRKQDLRSYMTLLQTVSGSSTLLEEFVKKYSFSALLKQIIKGMGIDTQAIELSMAEQEVMKPEFQKAGGGNPLQQPGAAQPGGSPDQMSQVPQAAGPQGAPQPDIQTQPAGRPQ